MKLFCTFAVLAAATMPVQAAFFDGNKLYEGCKASKDFVFGFVAGSIDTSETADLAIASQFVEADQMSNDKFRKSYLNNRALVRAFCAPQNATLNQYRDIYCQFLANNPGERHLQASLLLNKALMVAWPCK